MHAQPRRASRSLAESLDPRRNGLNVIRLALAIGVVLWHAVPLTGRTLDQHALHQVFATLPVDGFFVISGYLILGSWLSRPDLLRYLWARALRILPGFWASLVVTAAVIAPLGLLLSGVHPPGDYLQGAVAFVLGNAGLIVNHYDIAGTPSTLPYPDVWNGSLWTLWYEFVCYLAIAVLGVTGLLRRRFTVLVVFVLVLVFALVETFVVPGLAGGPLGLLRLTPAATARLALMFGAGMMLRQYGHRVPVRAPLLVVAVALIVVSTVLPVWELLSALPLAYVVLVAGSVMRHPRLQLRNDLSYGMYVYAFPVQQVLAGTALVGAPVLLFGVLGTVATLPFAAFSWFVVERSAKRLIRALPDRRGAVRPRAETLPETHMTDA